MIGPYTPIQRSSVKMLMLLNFEALLPEFVCTTDGKGADKTIDKSYASILEPFLWPTESIVIRNS